MCTDFGLDPCLQVVDSPLEDARISADPFDRERLGRGGGGGAGYSIVVAVA